MKKDVFPETLETWIGRKLLEGAQGRAEVNRHVMDVYSNPLQVYCRGVPTSDLGQPEELVQAFFADRLERDDLFSEWQTSGLRLRRWLMNGFAFFVKEERRRLRRNRRLQPLSAEPEAMPANIERELDRAFAISVVRKALDETRDACQGKGLSDHWEIFQKHFYEGRSYQDFAGEYRVTPDRAAEMARSAASRFRRFLRRSIASDGAPESAIDSELATFLEIAS